jgi:hypothetical protein
MASAGVRPAMASQAAVRAGKPGVVTTSRSPSFTAKTNGAKGVTVKTNPKMGLAGAAVASNKAKGGNSATVTKKPAKGGGGLSLTSNKPKGGNSTLVASKTQKGGGTSVASKPTLKPGQAGKGSPLNLHQRVDYQPLANYIANSKANQAQEKAILDAAQGKATPAEVGIIDNMLHDPRVPPAVKGNLLALLAGGSGNGGKPHHPYPGGGGGVAGCAGDSGGAACPTDCAGGTDAPAYDVAAAPAGSDSPAAAPAVSDSSAAAPGSTDGQGDDGGSAASSVLQIQRLLKVKNATAEKVTIWIQYRAHNTNDTWSWYPAAPGSDKAVAFELAPGEETYLEDEGWTLKAVRVRISARSASGDEWLDYRDKDLWLVEMLPDGYAYYYADEIETFTFTIQ